MCVTGLIWLAGDELHELDAVPENRSLSAFVKRSHRGVDSGTLGNSGHCSPLNRGDRDSYGMPEVEICQSSSPEPLPPNCENPKTGEKSTWDVTDRLLKDRERNFEQPRYQVCTFRKLEMSGSRGTQDLRELRLSKH